MGQAAWPRRVAVLSVHTSPLAQPGTGDAGGLNVYVAETARRMAERGTEVEVFTRATSSELPAVVEAAPGVLVRHVAAGPFEGLGKHDLPAQLCAFTAGVLRAEARRPAGHFDAVHSHYWLSGQVGWLARDRWRVPLVHTPHTLARVKNAALAADDVAEPAMRVIGEDQVVAEADRLVANTAAEVDQLVELCGADRTRTVAVAPGVDLDRFTPGDRAGARAELGLAPDAIVLAFVGRVQRLKAPDVLLRAAAELLQRVPQWRSRLVVLVAGGRSGTSGEGPEELRRLGAELGLGAALRLLEPRGGAELAQLYRAADVLAVPSHNESFGLVALEAQACGTPVVAARVGGLPVAVADGRSGLLVDGHRAPDWADAMAAAVDPLRWAGLSRGARTHAMGFSWDRTTEALLDVYATARAELSARAGLSARPRRSARVVTDRGAAATPDPVAGHPTGTIGG